MRNSSGVEPQTRPETPSDSSLTGLLRQHGGQQTVTTRPRPTSRIGRRRSCDVSVEAVAAVTAVTSSRRHLRPKSACNSRLRRAKLSSTDSGCCDNDDDDDDGEEEEDDVIYVDDNYLRRSSVNGVDCAGVSALSLAPKAWPNSGDDVTDDDGERTKEAKPAANRTTLLDVEPRRRVFSDSDVISGQLRSEHDVIGLERLAPMIAAERVLEKYRRRASLDTSSHQNFGVASMRKQNRPTLRTQENGQHVPRKLRPILARAHKNNLGVDITGRDDDAKDEHYVTKAQSQLDSTEAVVSARDDGSLLSGSDSASLLARDFGRSLAWKSLKPLESRRPSNPSTQMPR